MKAYFTDAITATQHLLAEVRDSRMPNAALGVTLICTDSQFAMKLQLPQAADVPTRVIAECVKAVADGYEFFHPTTGAALYLVYEGCDPEACYSFGDLLALRSPGKPSALTQAPYGYVLE